MKIKFTKLPTNDGIIKVSLDGGQSFTDYNVADVHESGIPLEDNQDYEKIQIQAPANVLKNLNVVSSVKVEGEGAETGSTNEFTNVLALAQNEISGFITRYNYSPKNFKGAAVTNNYFVRTNLENLGKDGGFSHYQCFEKDKLHNHLD